MLLPCTLCLELSLLMEPCSDTVQQVWTIGLLMTADTNRGIHTPSDATKRAPCTSVRSVTSAMKHCQTTHWRRHAHVFLCSTTSALDASNCVGPPWVFVVTLDAFQDLAVRGRGGQHAAERLKTYALGDSLAFRGARNKRKSACAAEPAGKSSRVQTRENLVRHARINWVDITVGGSVPPFPSLQYAQFIYISSLPSIETKGRRTGAVDSACHLSRRQQNRRCAGGGGFLVS